jgi:hypothetical protein
MNGTDEWKITKEGSFVYASSPSGRSCSFEITKPLDGKYRVIDFRLENETSSAQSASVAFVWGIPTDEITHAGPLNASDIKRAVRLRLIPARNEIKEELYRTIEAPKNPDAYITLRGSQMNIIEDDHLPFRDGNEYIYVTEFSVTW